MNAPTFARRLIWAGIFVATSLSSTVAQAQTCSTGLVYFTFGGRHYWRCNEAVTQATAQARCAGFAPIGGSPYYLARPETLAERNQLDANRGGMPLFIGATDITTEGTWRWTDGTTATWEGVPVVNAPTGTAPWNGGEPNNVGDEDCVEMQSGGTSGSWNDIGCGASRGFFCEGVLPPGYSCTNGAPCENLCASPTRSALGNSVYSFCNGPSGTKTWDNAQATCVRLGGNLTSSVLRRILNM